MPISKRKAQLIKARQSLSAKRSQLLYRQGVAYGSGEWKSLTSHQKVYVPGDDR